MTYPNKIDKTKTQDILSLTPMQESMLLQYLKAPGGEDYFEQLCLHIKGHIDTGMFKQAWETVTAANEMLRTGFRWKNIEQPVQVVFKSRQLDCQFHDLRDNHSPGNALETIKTQDRQQGFDLHLPPFRILLCRTGEDDYHLIISNHHILYDGWSTGIILKEFFDMYNRLVNGKKLPGSAPKPGYKEYVKWLRNRDKTAEETFWKQYLEGLEEPTRLPVTRAHAEPGKEVERYSFKCPSGTVEQLENIARARQITLAPFFYAAWGILLQRYCGIDDAAFGVTVSGRPPSIKGIENTVGLFINTIPMRVKTLPGDTMEQLAKRLDNNFREGSPFHYAPLAEINGYCSAARQSSQMLFDTLLVLENYPLAPNLTGNENELVIESYSMVEKTGFDLTVGIKLYDGIEIEFLYDPGRITGDMIHAMAGHLERIIETAARQPLQETDRLDMLSEEETKQLLVDFNRTEVVFPQVQPLYPLFSNQAQRTPHRIALAGPRLDNDSPIHQITYSLLHHRVSHMAGQLKAKSVCPGDIVAVSMERSIEAVITILAILESGAAYLPVNPKDPAERIDYILRDSRAKFLIDKTFYRQLESVVPAESGAAESPALNPDVPCYVLYTSGSTGTPKGVVISHRNIFNTLHWFADTFRIEPGVHVMQLTEYTFDPSVEDIFGSLLFGAALFFAHNDLIMDRVGIRSFIRRHQIEVINYVPDVLDEILSEGKRLNSLRTVISGGMALREEVKNRILSKGYTLYNNYGPTEASVDALYSICSEKPVTLGKPIANTEVFILDPQGRPVPIGIPGELVIRGPGITQGYLNDPAQSHQSTLMKSFCGAFYKKRPAGGIFFKTGDRVRRLPCGDIEYIGRIDDQVKIRGYRVELGEIESQLLLHASVRGAAVLLYREENRSALLCAYVEVVEGLDVEELKRYLESKLPDYMVPGHFVAVDEIPRTVSGKIDRGRLPVPGFGGEVEVVERPVGDIEKDIAGIWKRALGIDHVGRSDNFFDIGGNSLTILRVHSRISARFKMEIPVAILFKYPTVRGLAEYIDSVKSGTEDGQEPESFGAPSAQSRAGFGDIAVIGMSGRFPGARNVGEFWERLENGDETITFFTPGELDEAGIARETREHPGYVNAYGIALDMEYFDAAFFGYPHGDAVLMDPQLRVLHECVWEALEDAGYSPGEYEGRIGLFAGALINSQRLSRLAGDLSQFSSQTQMGSLNDRDFFCTRIAYKLNLRGPAITVQTACSTSLVAIDSACRALWTGQCHMALAGGAAVSPANRWGYLYEEGMVHSPDGHCRAFDAEAGGTVGGNGAGIVLLKPLSAALADGDSIDAVIKGSAVNNDGLEKVGYTAPSVSGQADVINEAIAMASVPYESIGYIETHGTGTKLGDPIEIAGLKQAFNSVKTPGYSCALGAVKTNIGHLDAAAGAAGFIKTVLALKHGVIPPTLHYRSPNPDTQIENSPFYVNTRLLPWPQGPYPRRAGVSSFGIGGTNAHVILEEFRATGGEKKPLKNGYHLLLLSARTREALDRMTANLSRFLSKHPRVSLADTAYTLQTGRARFRCRKALAVRTIEDARAALEQDINAETHILPDAPAPQVVFMFPGQGSQYVHMGRDLYRTEPVFKREMDRCFQILEPLLGFDLKEKLFPTSETAPADSLTPTSIAQPVLFTIEYSLARLLFHWGIRPSAMTGHSIGQYTAACIAGVFPLETALALVVERGQLMENMPPGSMLSIALPPRDIETLLPDQLDVAAINSPDRTVVSGPHEEIETFARELTEKGIKVRELHTSHAFHSSMMDPILEDFSKAVARFKPKEPQIPVICNITGQPLSPEQAQDPAYWASHLRRTVRFADGIGHLMTKGTNITKSEGALFLEVGPGNTLCTFVNQHNDKKTGHTAIHLLPHPSDAVEPLHCLYRGIGKLWLQGVEPDWSALHGQPRQRLHLPTYPFKREHFEDCAAPCLAPMTSSKSQPGMMLVDAKGERPEMDVEYEAATNETEEKLVGIYRELFGLKQPGVHDSFFELGGDSLKAISLSGEIKAALEIELPLSEIFQRQTIHKIALYIDQQTDHQTDQQTNRHPHGLTAAEESGDTPQEIDLYKKFPMTPIQVAYVMGRHDLFDIGGVGTHLYQETRIDFEIERFNRALNTMIARHPMFRVIALPDGYQKFVDVEGYHIVVEDLTEMTQDQREDVLLKERERMSHQMYDPGQWPLFEFKAFKLAEKQYYILLSIDHFIADAASMLMFAREMGRLIEYPQLPLPPLDYTFRDYVLACEEQRNGGAYEQSKGYWMGKKKYFPDAPGLPMRKKPSEVENPHFKRLQAEFTNEQWQDLKRISASRNITFSTLLCTAYAEVLSYWSGQTSLAVNLTLFNRLPFHKDVDKIIGDFTSIILLGLDITPGGDFWEHAADVQRTLLEALEHRQYDGIEFMRELRRGRNSGTEAIMPIVFTSAAFEFNHQDEMEDEAFSLFESHRDTGMAISQTSQVYIDCGVGQIKDRLELGWDYVEELFDQEVIETMFRQYVGIISSVINGETAPGLQPPRSQQMLIETLNAPQLEEIRQKTVHQLFSEQVQRTPHRIALTGPSVYDGLEEISITYAQLDELARALAIELGKKGAGHLNPATEAEKKGARHQIDNCSDQSKVFAGFQRAVSSERALWPPEAKKGARHQIVAVEMKRTVETVAAFLGVLYASAAYLPVDPGYPAERIEYMLNDSAAALCITAGKQGKLPFHIRELNGGPNVSFATKEEALPGDPCYIIYTSGTTGKPKGSMISHQNVVSLLANNNALFQFDHRDVWTLFHSTCFDFSVWEMYAPLMVGARVIAVPKIVARAPGNYLELLQRHQVTVLNQTPTAFSHLSSFEFRESGKRLALRYVIFGGEALYPAMLAPWQEKYPGARFINMFGITETTVHVTFKEITEEDIRFNRSNIGKPLGSLGIFIVDRAGRPAPLGVAGELRVTGGGVALGYLNRPALTAEKFVPHPTIPGQRIYCSGDLARLNRDGDLEYLGRMDRQVKIRGFRIEPGEIEGVFNKHPDISAAAVVVKQANNNDHYLCAYFVSNTNIEIPALREYLSRSLAEYMVPSYFIPLSALPLTANGKLDFSALPEPVVERESEYVTPANEIEKTMVEIWADVLGIEASAISTEQSFFQLGGHSLNATRMADDVHQRFNARLPLAEIFRTPTVKELAAYLDDSAKERFTPLEAVETREYYPLSSAQMRLYVMNQLDPLGVSYNLPFQVELQGSLNRSNLETAFRQLIERHESLRTSFIAVDGQPVQRVHATEDISINIGDHAAGFVKPFDLGRAPLMRVGLVQMEKNKNRLMIDLHHIISDEVSLDIFIADLKAYYRGTPLPALNLQYKDFSQWRNGAGESERLKLQGNYWLAQYNDSLPVLELPLDFPRPMVRDSQGEALVFEVPAQLTRLLNEYALSEGSTLYMVLLGMFNILLSRLSGQDDIIVGTPVAGRRHADLGQIIGMFVNTLALRNRPVGSKRGQDFLAEVKENTLNAFENQEYPFEDLVEHVAVERNSNRNPLFDVLFAMQNADIGWEDTKMEQTGGEDIFPAGNQGLTGIDSHTSKFDLSLDVFKEDDHLLLSFEYSTQLFKPQTIHRFNRYFQVILQHVLEAPGSEIGHIRLIDEEEAQWVLEHVNANESDYPLDKKFHHFVEEQAERTPDRVAVYGQHGMEGGDPNFHITYSFLVRQALEGARQLRENGVGSGDIAAVKMTRSPLLIALVLSVLNTGAAYLPVDPALPRERIDYMLKDSNAGVIIEDGKVDGGWKITGLGLGTNRISALKHTSQYDDGVCYVIYTSGSTGMPKGVVVSHSQYVNIALGWREAYGLEDIPGEMEPVHFQVASFSFDVFAGDVARALVNGGRLVICPDHVRTDLELFHRVLLEQRVSHFESTPGLILPLMEYIYQYDLDVGHLKLLILGSDTCSVEDFKALYERFGQRMRIVNSYGITEVAIDSSFYETGPDTAQLRTVSGSVPIGKPFPNTKMYILDAHGNLQPQGISGELYIGGPSIANGYLNNPELTNERFSKSTLNKSFCGAFYKKWAAPTPSCTATKGSYPATNVSNPLRKSFCGAFYKKRPAGGIFFRTGDRVRYLADGSVEFLGRLDEQVKVRGFRIELGEIEDKLRRFPGVKEAVAAVKRVESGDAVLCGYVVMGVDGVDEESIKEYLSGCLPGYMVPSFVLGVEEIPLSASGKVDRRLLPVPSGVVEGVGEAPRDSLEVSLAGIWFEVLEREVSGIDENFFASGGHSLRAAVMVLKIHKALHVRIPLAELFRAPTIRGLARFIRGGEEVSYRAIEAVEAREYYPVSAAQKRLFILQQLEPKTTAYNMPDLIPLPVGDGSALEDLAKNMEPVLLGLIERHESLRASFHMIHEKPVQRVHEVLEDSIDITCYRRPPGEVVDDFIRPFDLSCAPLVRAALYEHPNGNARALILDMHHIIADGISQKLLTRDLFALMEGGLLAPQVIQYKEFVLWQETPGQRETLERQEAYWLDRFSGQLPVLDLPTDFVRPRMQSFSGGTIDFRLSLEQTRALNELAVRSGSTLFMTLLALYSLLMSKLSTKEDIVIGSPMAGRGHTDLENVVGMFVNTIPLRSYPSGEKTFAAYLNEVTQDTLKAFENQDYPFERLVEKVEVGRDLSRNPLFDVMLVLQNFNLSHNSPQAVPGDVGENVFKEFDNLLQTAKFDLTLTGAEVDGQLLFSFEYADKLFKPETVRVFISNFKTLVDGVVKEPGSKISSLEIIDSKEKRRLLYDFNDTRRKFPESKTIPQLFADQVSRTPDRIALVSPTGQMSYREMDRCADVLADELKNRGIGIDDCVGLMVPRSLEMIIAVYGILKAGAAYLPIDPDYPEERKEYMLSDSGARTVIGTVENNGALEIQGLGSGSARLNPGNPHLPGKPHSPLCYVIYTSGSTGKPKGVMVETRGFVNLLSWYIREFHMDQSDNNLMIAPVSFDLSQKNMYATLLTGGCLTLAPAGIPDYTVLTRIVETRRITIINCAPSVFYPLVELNADEHYRQLCTLRLVVLGGEPIQREKLRPWVLSKSFNADIINTYGPTECTDIAAGYTIPAEAFGQDQEIPIGAPIQNVSIYILDKYLHLLQTGIAGELCIGGTGLSRGYYNNDALTAEKFVSTPHLPHNFIYRTGDMALWLPDGNARFVGRIDQQVKVRGLRIELGEIETCLRLHEDIQDAAVTVRSHGSGENYICAYMITDNRDDKSFKEHLSQSLPDYMIPSCFMRLEKIPLTPSGKVDKKALPQPQFEPGKDFTAPRDDVEARLAQLWADVLERPGAIDIDTGFFEIGGHSLKATVLVSRIHKAFNIKLKLADIFQHATIREMARQVKSSGTIAYNEVLPVEERDYYELSYAQRRLWILCQFEEDAVIYNMPNAIIIDGAFNPGAFSRAIQTLIQRHESFRTLFISINGQPRQKILRTLDYEPEHIDLRHLPPAERDEEAKRLFFETANAAINLETGPLFRFVLLRLQDDRYALVYCIHHLINDGWSQGIFYNEFFSLYNAYCHGNVLSLAHPGLRYRDYTLWHNQLINGGHFDDAGRYWLEKFKDKPNGIELPFDYPRQPVQTFNGGLVQFNLDAQQTAALQDLCRENDVTLFIYLLNIVNIFLYKYSGQEDIIIGAPIANRKRPELYPLVGFLVNTLVYRSRVEPGSTFNQLLEQVKKEALDCYQYQDYPFDLLIEKLDLNRDLSQSPIFNVMIAHNNTDTDDGERFMEGAELSLYPYADQYNISRFDLIFAIDEIDDYIRIGLEYNSDLFDLATIERMAENFIQLTNRVIADTNEPVHALPIITQDQYRTVTQEFNDTRQAFPDISLTGMFEQRAGTRSSGTAVVYEGEGISYEELNRQANRLAHYLLDVYAVEQNQVIGISMERSIHMIAVILAAMKSGAAYLAVDPTYPPERVRHILSDSRAHLVIIDKDRPALLGDYPGELLNIHALEQEIIKQPDHNPGIVNQPSDILYVNYTSGSTGTPNGAMLSHDCLTNLIKWQNFTTTIDCSLRCLQFTSINFCVSFQEIMGTLTSGGELYLIGETERQDIDYLMDFLSRWSINILFLPFSYLNFLFNESNRWDRDFRHDLRHIITAGEQLKVSSGLKRFLEINPHIQLHNHYGSTEMHVVTSYTLTAAEAEKTPIPPAGSPIDNISIYILDPHLNPVPAGVYGELCVAGSSEILGYAFNKELTAEKMISCPALSDIKLYRSGDIGRWLPDGNIQLRGRKDSLVKVRGFRVEPGEIESRILAIPGIRECVVTVREDEAARKYLAAYISVIDETIDAAEIKQVIGKRLPQYMLPKMVFLDSLPLMPNGKVDKEKLPDPQDSPLENAVHTAYNYWLQQMDIPGAPPALSSILYEWPGVAPLPGGANPEASPEPAFHQFARQAETEPHKTALVFPHQHVSYGNLMDTAKRLAPQLIANGAGPGKAAALLGESSPQMTAAMLSLMHTGGKAIQAPLDTPSKKLDTLFREHNVSLVLTGEQVLERYSYTALQGLPNGALKIHRTPARPPVPDLDTLPLPDRSLVNYEKYSRSIGITMVKDCMTLLSSRGCPYHCAYCHKIWPKKQLHRSAENIFEEVKMHYDLGVRRFAFLDDIFNLSISNSSRFFRLILQHKMKIQIFFPSGLRGDILTPEFIDLMVEAGAVGISAALETASPRLQKLLGKHLRIEKLRDNLNYIAEKYPHVIQELQTMHGFPTETEEEAMMTLDFVKSIRWLDFPYVHLVRIYPNTPMEELALAHGVSKEAIHNSENMAYHQWSETLPFDRNFTRNYQTDFLHNYFLNPERLRVVLNRQLKIMCESDMVQKYNSYLPEEIKSLDHILACTGISKDELNAKECVKDDAMRVPQLNSKLRSVFPAVRPDKDATRLLLLDLSQFFTGGANLYDVVEAPLGLMSLLTYLNRSLGSRLHGKIAKARVDFDSFEQLTRLLDDFAPHVIGIRCLTFHNDFFHRAAALIRRHCPRIPIMTGGPYASSDYQSILQDPNIDLVVYGEGEVTFLELMRQIMANNRTLPPDSVLSEIPGLIYIPNEQREARNAVQTGIVRQVMVVEDFCQIQSPGEPPPVPLPGATLVFEPSPRQLLRPLAAGGALCLFPLTDQLRKIPIAAMDIRTDQNGIAEARAWIKKDYDAAAANKEKTDAPESEIEVKLAAAWARVLGIDAPLIGVDDNFFELGGHSLKITVLTSNIHELFGVKITMSEIFKNPTIRGIAGFIEKSTEQTLIDTGGDTGTVPEIEQEMVKVEEKEYYPLSYNQQRLWFLERMQSGGSAYNMPGVVELEGAPNEETIKEAVLSLIRRHESLRTGFRVIADRPVQFIVPAHAVTFDIQWLDFSQLPPEEKARRQEALYAVQQDDRFDLNNEIPLLRALLLKLEEGRYQLIFNMHHIITDGWSMEIIKHDFLQFYEGLKKDIPYEPEPPALQYKDYAAWNHAYLSDPVNTKQVRQAWREKIGKGFPAMNLPVIPGRDPNDGTGALYTCMVDAQTLEKLTLLAANQRTTLFPVLFAAYLMTISRTVHQQDIVCSVISSGRDFSQLNHIVGFFVNSLLFSATVPPDHRFDQFLEQVNGQAVEMFRDQQYPPELVFKELKIQYPRVPVSFNMLNISHETGETEMDAHEPYHTEEAQDVKFDIEAYVTPYKNGIGIEWAYKKQLFSPVTIEYIASEYIKILELIAQDPGLPISCYKTERKKQRFKRTIKEPASIDRDTTPKADHHRR